MPAIKPLCVLLVDDDEVSLYALYAILRTAGMDVLKAADGAEALAVLKDRKPDAVVTDVMMPILGGFGLSKVLRVDPVLAA